jgi:hypothetical protein
MLYRATLPPIFHDVLKREIRLIRSFFEYDYILRIFGESDLHALIDQLEDTLIRFGSFVTQGAVDFGFEGDDRPFG